MMALYTHQHLFTDCCVHARTYWTDCPNLLIGKVVHLQSFKEHVNVCQESSRKLT